MGGRTRTLGTALAVVLALAPLPRPVAVARPELGHPGAGPLVRFERTAELAGLALTEDPWSPQGLRLALLGPGGLYLHDAGSSEPRARLIHAGAVRAAIWSPDGGALLVAVADPLEPRLVSLFVRAFEGDTAARRVARRFDLGGWWWSADGRIQLWDGTTGARRTLVPPAGPRPAPDSAARARPALVLVRDPATRVLLPFRVEPAGDSATVIFVEALRPPTTAKKLGIEDRFTDGRALIRRNWPEPVTEIVDAWGRSVRVVAPLLGPAAFEGRSVSPDGRWIAGARDVKPTEEDGGGLQVWLYAVEGEVTVRVEGTAPTSEPRFARRDTLLAYGTTGAVHVGRLRFTAP
jgi:hypothetical protein